MEKSYGQADPKVVEYVERVFGVEDEVLAGIRNRQTKAGLPAIEVGPLDGLHLEVIARAASASRVVEIGTLGGYSGVCLLRGMAAGGTLYTFEWKAEHAAVARDTFAAAEYGDRAKVFVGKAIELLPSIEKEGPFDLVFIDADKSGYPGYLAWAAKHLRIGGVVLADNAFLFGKVASEPTEGDAAEVRAMQSFNDALARGGRFRATMLPTGEGLAMGVKVR